MDQPSEIIPDQNSRVDKIIAEQKLQTERLKIGLTNVSEDINSESKDIVLKKIKAEEKIKNEDFKQYGFIRKIRTNHKKRLKNLVQYSHVIDAISETGIKKDKIKKALESNKLKRLKKEAKKLKKDLRSCEDIKMENAVKRISILECFAGMSTEEILETKPKHKFCLDAIAKEKGFADWTDLRKKIEKNESLKRG